MKEYQELKKINTEYYILCSVIEFLDHDREAEMPVGASEFRGTQIGVLAQLKNRLMKNEELKNIFEKCRNNKELNELEKTDVEESYRNWIHESGIPDDLIAKIETAKSFSMKIWSDAKNGKATFKDLLPYLEQIFEIEREIANKKSDFLKLSPYDCLIDEFQPGLKQEKIDFFFDELKAFLPTIIEKRKNIPVIPLKDYPKDKKLNYVKRILDLMNFNFEQGRRAEVIHPHSSGPAFDSIIAVNYNADLISLTYSAIHECGHALYQQQLTNCLTAVGQQRGMAIHESQSLFFEKQIGKNEKFINILAQILREEFESVPELSSDNILNTIRQVEPSFIRIDADEVTYPLHIIMRYEIERDIINGKMKVKDLPEIWNAKMKEYLGITPPNDLLGCLQDVHWIVGLVGYFPSYTMGAIIASQLMEKIRTEIKNIDGDLEKGDLKNITKWLNDNIHKYGSSIDFEELIKRATGQELSIASFKKHLTNRYL
jgi:carboxypeptidase Taq